MADEQIRELLEKIDQLIKRIAEKDAIIEKLSEKVELLTIAANDNATRTIYEKRQNSNSNKVLINHTHKRAHDEVSSQETDEDTPTQASLEAMTKPTSKKARRKARKLAEMEKRKFTHNEQAEEDDILSHNRFSNLSEDYESTDNHTRESNRTNPHSDKITGDANGTKMAETTPTQDSSMTRKVPPVILHNKDKYMRMSNLANSTGISIIKAKTLKDGIAFHPQTELDYRKLVRLFIRQGVQYHTYQLPSEKLLYVVIKGISEPIETSEIKEELEKRGFHPENVSRMRSRKDKRALHMVLVTVPKTENSIYKIRDILGLVVTVEDQKSPNRVSQCHRCQRFGHAQSRCAANPKCVKCAGNHLTSECTIDKQTPPKCANCLQQHPASYRGCSAWPKVKQTYVPKNTSTAVKNPSQTYASVARNNKELNFSSLYENFRIMHSQMLEMTKQLGQMFQANENK